MTNFLRTALIFPLIGLSPALVHAQTGQHGSSDYQDGYDARFADEPSLLDVPASQIAADVSSEVDPRTGLVEKVGPVVDPFGYDETLAGAVNLRTAQEAIDLNGQRFQDGVLVELSLFFNDEAESAYDLTRDAIFLNGEIAPLILRDRVELECSSRVTETIYTHDYYYSGRRAGYYGLYRPRPRYSLFFDLGFGHRDRYRRRPHYRDVYRGYGRRGDGRSGRPRYTRDIHPRRADGRRYDRDRRDYRDQRDDRDQRRSRDQRSDERRGYRRDEGRNQNRQVERRREDRARTIIPDRVNRGNASNIRTPRSYRQGSDIARVRNGRDRDDNSRRNRSEDRATPRRHNVETRTESRVTSPQIRRESRPDATRLNSLRQQVRENRPTVERRGNNRPRVDRPRVDPPRRETRSEPRRAPQPRPQRESRPKSKPQTVKRPHTIKADPKRLNFFPAGGSDTVVVSSTRDCAYEDRMRVFVSYERLEAARFDGLSLVVRDVSYDQRIDQTTVYDERVITLPPNYVEGFLRSLD